MHRTAPWIIFGVFMIYVGAAAFAPEPAPDGFRIGAFARLPVVMNGRLQPIESVARAGLLRIRGTLTEPGRVRGWQFWNRPRPLEASEWLLEVLTKPDVADGRRIFPIHDPALIAALHLDAPAGGAQAYYTYAERRRRRETLGQQAIPIEALDASRRAPWETECRELPDTVAV